MIEPTGENPELVHWKAAIDALSDLDAIASPEAWAALEEYLSLEIRDRLRGIAGALKIEAARVGDAAGRDGPDWHGRMLDLRDRYLQAETILGFFGHAIASRTTGELGGLLRGLDAVAAASLRTHLEGLGIEAPPILVYIDQGLGAAILRAGVRLWDGANPSPVAAIRVARHNLCQPTALFHETGHQFAHLTGWSAELAEALWFVLRPRSRHVAELWRSWAGEVAADVHAFALCGWSPVPALANVVDGPTAAATRVLPGDPHPYPLVRVLLNAALCASWFGPGPWDDLARTWMERHLGGHHVESAGVTRLSMNVLPDIVDACTRRPMAAFGGRPLAAVINPRRTSPGALAAMAAQAGQALLSSSYLAARDPVRILAWLVGCHGQADAHPIDQCCALRSWVISVGGSGRLAHPRTAAA